MSGGYERPVEFQRSRRKAAGDRPEGLGFVHPSSVEAVFREGSEIRELAMHLRHRRTQTIALPASYPRKGFVLWHLQDDVVGRRKGFEERAKDRQKPWTDYAVEVDRVAARANAWTELARACMTTVFWWRDSGVVGFLGCDINS